MKKNPKNKCKKKKYSAPKLNRHDVKSLTSDWSFGVYGALVPGGCGSCLD